MDAAFLHTVSLMVIILGVSVEDNIAASVLEVIGDGDDNEDAT